MSDLEITRSEIAATAEQLADVCAAIDVSGSWGESYDSYERLCEQRDSLIRYQRNLLRMEAKLIDEANWQLLAEQESERESRVGAARRTVRALTGACC